MALLGAVVVRVDLRPELGFRLLQKLADDVTELGFVESQPKQDGRNMIMVIGPHRRKVEVRSEPRAAAPAQASPVQASPVQASPVQASTVRSPRAETEAEAEVTAEPSAPAPTDA